MASEQENNPKVVPPTPAEILEGNVSGRPGIALPVDKIAAEEPKERDVKLGPTEPTQNPVKARGWWEASKK